MKTKQWILLFLVIFLLCAAAAAWMLFAPSKAQIAEIYQDGSLIQAVDLSAVTRPQEITVSGDHGEENRILITRGAIKMQSANCPDQLCVRMGSIRNATVPIVCLPHRIVIKIKANPVGADAVTN